MRIKNLQIKNFRNLEKINCHPHEHLNIFTGNNAQGKTNILESIYVLAAGSSFRSASDADMVRYQSDNYFIKSSYLNMERNIESSLSYSINGQKTLTFNHKKANLSHPDRLRVVLFSPDDLLLVKGPPANRRMFLDFMLKQLSEEYLYNLNNYAKILKKRNFLLKNEQTNGKSFSIVNTLFIENAIKIILQRINFINLLDEITSPIYLKSNSGNNDLKIRYALSFVVNSDKINLNILENSMNTHISQNLNNEIRRKKSLVGPHLDDIHFYQDGKIARVFSSQGQQRNMVVSLMLGEIYAFKRIKGFFPIFLLDEVLSELDDNKKKYLIEKLANAPFQTFLSSVNYHEMDCDNKKIYLLKDGKIS